MDQQQALELLRTLALEPNIAALGVTTEDGAPHITPVWVDFADGHLLVNTAEGRFKVNAVRLRPEVGVLVVDRNNAYRWASALGKVVEITTDGADEHIDKLAKKYLGHDKYQFRRPGEVRVILKIEPVRVLTFGV
jgi:PPOX class probable F420-dependent enzyme